MSRCTYLPLLLVTVSYKPLSVSESAVHMIHLHLDNAGNRSLCQSPTVPSYMQGTVTKKVSHVCHFRPQETVQIVIVARVKLQEEETVARGAPQRRQVSEGLFSLMREGIIKSLMGLFKKHQERKWREKPTKKTQE